MAGRSIDNFLRQPYIVPLIITTVALVYSIYNKKKLGKIASLSESQKSECCCSGKSNCSSSSKCSERECLIVFYASETGTSKSLAMNLCSRVKEQSPKKLDVFLFDCNQFEKILQNPRFKGRKVFLVFILSTYIGGDLPENGRNFFEFLKDCKKNDKFLPEFESAIFVLGNSSYREDFCRSGKEIEVCLKNLGFQFLVESNFWDGDKEDNLDEIFEAWTDVLLRKIEVNIGASDENGAILYESEDEGVDASEIGDIEDLIPIADKEKSSRDMVTPIVNKTLKKQGYKIVASHSAVKTSR